MAPYQPLPPRDDLPYATIAVQVGRDVPAYRPKKEPDGENAEGQKNPDRCRSGFFELILRGQERMGLA